MSMAMFIRKNVMKVNRSIPAKYSKKVPGDNYKRISENSGILHLV